MGLWSKARAVLNTIKGSNSGEAVGCDHRHVPHKAGTPEFELYVAQAELKAGNLQHGARHLAHLISYEPANQDWLALLDAYLRRVNDDESKLWPIKDKRYFAEEAVRSYCWARQGKVKEALELLVQVVEAKPDSGYLDAWALNWLDDDAKAIPGKLIERILATGLNQFPEHRWLGRSARRRLERYAELASRVSPGMHDSATFPMLHAGLLRKLGRFEQAIAIARQATLTAPDWHSYVAEGLALRERGDYEGAATAFERALTYEPEDLSARLEAGDGYLQHKVWDKAHDWYSQVIQRQPNHDWALPSVLFCKWKLSGDALKHKRLVEMARRSPVNRRAAQLLRVNEPYVGILPAPADAMANACRSITRSLRENSPNEPGHEVTINLSHLESPSATLAFEEQLKSFRHPPKLKVTVKEIPKPDPRIPCRPVKHELWTYTGTNAKPSLARPAQAILDVLAQLASNPYDRDENWNDAKLAARGFTEDEIPQILAAMVNPPPIPAEQDALAWVPRIQLAAAYVVAHIGAGWQSSARKDALLSALWGPRDWTTVAAIITLVHLAEENREIELDVHDAFKTLSEFIPDGGYCCFEHALFTCWQWLPSLTEDEKRRFQERVLDLQE